MYNVELEIYLNPILYNDQETAKIDVHWQNKRLENDLTNLNSDERKNIFVDENDMNLLEVVLVTYDVGCMLSKVIDGLHRFGNPKPKKYHIITPSFNVVKCKNIFQQQENLHITCYDERKIVNMTKKTLYKYFNNILGWNETNGLNYNKMGRYIQQFFKLFAILSIDNPSLPQYYQIWDADMILIKKYNFFIDNKMRVNIGGHISSSAFIQSTMAILGLHKFEQKSNSRQFYQEYNINDDDNIGWMCYTCTTHQMLVKKAIMIEILNQIYFGKSVNNIQDIKLDPNGTKLKNIWDSDNNNNQRGQLSVVTKLISKIPNLHYRKSSDMIFYKSKALAEYSMYYQWSLLFHKNEFKMDNIIRFHRYRFNLAIFGYETVRCTLGYHIAKWRALWFERNVRYIGIEEPE